MHIPWNPSSGIISRFCAGYLLYNLFIRWFGYDNEREKCDTIRLEYLSQSALHGIYFLLLSSLELCVVGWVIVEFCKTVENLKLLSVEGMASIGNALLGFPFVGFRSKLKQSQFPLQIRSSVSEKASVGKESSGSRVEENKKEKDAVHKKLDLLWDDEFENHNGLDYLNACKDMIKSDGGPPRWFCPVECGRPLDNSPVLLYLPGLDGLGLGLMPHHKSLGKVFEVCCLHIPVCDQTPFEGLLEFVEDTVKLQQASSPNKPIYLVGDSFGACLALAVAARNPTIDLVLILVNPATSYSRSYLPALLTFLEALPAELDVNVPFLLNFTKVLVNSDELTKVPMIDIKSGCPASKIFEHFLSNFTALVSFLTEFSSVAPKDTFRWKLKLLKLGAGYANSRLHAVKSEVLVLASCSDSILPSEKEGRRLDNSLQNCKVRYFRDQGHILLMEDGINILTIIKGTYKYRRAKRRDFVLDFIPPSMSEFKNVFDEGIRRLHVAASPVMFSTLENGKVVRGLSGVPNEGPVLLVGYHMMFGLEICLLVEGFLREKNVMVHGMAHPLMFTKTYESLLSANSPFDYLKVFGAIPVTPTNFSRLLSTNSYMLLYPGGVRETLHRKGENYKLFWPERPEFVRMAAKYGATIVPFGIVGEDDFAELAVDYNDLMSIPIFKDILRLANDGVLRLRTDMDGEVANQDVYIPLAKPKIPGRFYFLFGKPIETKGRREEILRDKECAKEVYLEVKSDVESAMAYLVKKREDDPYRSLLQRTIYHAITPHVRHVPSFEP